VTLNANQYGALCSWAFNEGCGNVGSSTLISRLNAGEDPVHRGEANAEAMNGRKRENILGEYCIL